MRTVGVIGGLGPETTSEFYLKIINLCRKQNKIHYPPILIYSVPVPFKVEQDIVEMGKNEEKMLPVLIDGVKKLKQSKVDFIVIPCNTVHSFIDNLRKIISTPILSIIEETSKKCKTKGYQKVGILSTKKTIEKKLYDKELERFNIELLTPTVQEQKNVSEIIFRILSGKKSKDDKEQLLQVVKGLEKKGAEAIILGCTDLQLLLSQKDSKIKFLDTVEIFAKATVNEILRNGTS